MFYNWNQQESGIILFPDILKLIYPSDYIFDDNTLRAWKAMFRACRSWDITPFEKKVSSNKFWTRLENYKNDKEILKKLYKDGLLKLASSIESIEFINDESIQKKLKHTKQFWNSFKFAYKNNIQESNRKTRILSIIAELFTFLDLKNHLKVIL